MSGVCYVLSLLCLGFVMSRGLLCLGFVMSRVCRVRGLLCPVFLCLGFVMSGFVVSRVCYV